MQKTEAKLARKDAKIIQDRYRLDRTWKEEKERYEKRIQLFDQETLEQTAHIAALEAQLKAAEAKIAQLQKNCAAQAPNWDNETYRTLRRRVKP